jgi:hypothetical protein
MDRLAGGWQLAGTLNLQSGGPVSWEDRNVIYYGGDLNWNARNIPQAFDVSRFEHSAALNNPTSGNFGRITSQANLPRTIQLALRLTF